jgi:hypothetical protein
MDTLELETQRLRALQAMQAGLLELKLLRDITRLDRAMRDHLFALKYGYNPNQPRVPRGQREGGQWVDDGGSSGRIVLAGDIPTNDTPEVPKERPGTSQGRTAALKVAARYGGAIGKIIEAAEWVREHSPIVESYRDLPKSLEELQRDTSTRSLGYDIHHIVEQTQAESEGFTREQIDAPDNLAKIPRMKHWEINGWFSRSNPNYGWQTPHDYLSGRSWGVRRAVGLEALRIHGVLKP